MSNLITLKRRIGSVKSTRQITKAMELVAASKMRKSQDAAKASRDYQAAAYALLRRLNDVTEISTHPLFRERDIKRRTYLLITSSRGLAGAYNANALRLLTARLKDDSAHGVAASVIAVGNKGANFLRRVKGVELIATFPAFEETPTVNDLRPLLAMLIDSYSAEQTDAVDIIYTKLVSNISQVASVMPVLPATFKAEDTPTEQSLRGVTFEPSPEEVLESVTERLIEALIWQAVLESNAGEQSMRMLAMKNATDNANELIGDLTLVFNSGRQAAITQELAEISGGAEAMKETM